MNEEKKRRARENAKRYYQKNKEKILKRQKEYAKKRYMEDEEFRKKIKEKNRNYIINNPEKAREIKRKSQYKYINKKRLSGELPLTQKMLIDNLQQQNQELKEQVEYLRRSCERKEDTIISLQQDLTIIDELEIWLKSFTTEEFNYNFLVVRIKDILDKVNELKGVKENENN